jgi:hypothetical protein
MTQGPLPAILLAANDHPEPDFREHLWSRLDDWLDLQEPMIDHRGMDSIVSHQTGTFLEPFRLAGDARRTALFLTRLALRQNSPASRFRLVSEDTIGNEGGLVITKNQKSFYSERYELGKNRLINSNIRFFAPSMKTRGPMRRANLQAWHASMHSDDKGMYVELPTQILELAGWIDSGEEPDLKSLAGELLTNSRMGPKKLAISSIGVGVEVTENGVRLAVKSPEALIRFSGYVVKSQSIRLIAKSPFQLSVQLPNTAEGPAPITVVASDGFASEWMDVNDLGAPTLEPTDIARIADWSFHHTAWLD